MVYIGFWTNGSQGRVLGARLTLDWEDSNLLVAFITFCITIVTTSLWKIACIILHHLYLKPEPQDALYHQRQALLRNSTSAGAGL
ncbi:hypothetical protein F4778DRAFT_730968 [Xylariomycetidae sp. FL2044]|nr:hypothetical protein F4778DRAFT_730968 [Xylariomycetidae sp. FL2044]